MARSSAVRRPPSRFGDGAAGGDQVDTCGNVCAGARCRPKQEQGTSPTARQRAAKWRADLTADDSLLGGAVIHQRQPSTELVSRLLRRGPVKRHHRGRQSRQARNLRPPAGLRHRPHLDEIRAPGNDVLRSGGCSRCLGTEGDDRVKERRVRDVQNCRTQCRGETSEGRIEALPVRHLVTHFWPDLGGKFFFLSTCPQAFHQPSTGFQHACLDACGPHHYAGNVMRSLARIVALGLALVVPGRGRGAGRPARCTASISADGTALVSFGEWARVDDRSGLLHAADARRRSVGPAPGVAARRSRRPRQVRALRRGGARGQLRRDPGRGRLRRVEQRRRRRAQSGGAHRRSHGAIERGRARPGVR